MLTTCCPHWGRLQTPGLHEPSPFLLPPSRAGEQKCWGSACVVYHHSITFDLRKVGRRPNSSRKMFLSKDQPWHMRTLPLSRQAQWLSGQEGMPNPLHVAPGTAIGICGGKWSLKACWIVGTAQHKSLGKMKGVETTCVMVTQREAHEVERKEEGQEGTDGECTRFKTKQNKKTKPSFC